MTETFIICIIGGYLLGSVPFGLVVTRLAGLGDIRKIGSGNIGATNVLRTGRKDLALLTVLLDASKAGFAAWLALRFVPAEDMFFAGIFTSTNLVAALYAGTAAIIGHNFPVWLKFKGGKGVASTFGFILVINPAIALMALATWLVFAFLFKIFFPCGAGCRGADAALRLFLCRRSRKRLFHRGRSSGGYPPSCQHPPADQGRRKQNFLRQKR